MTTGTGIAEMIKEQRGRCFYCGHALQQRPRYLYATIDHKLPKWQGGTSARDNLVAACTQCNELKGPLDAETFKRLRTNRKALMEAKSRANTAQDIAKRKPEPR